MLRPSLRPLFRWTLLALTVLAATAIVLPRLGRAQTPCNRTCDAALQDSKGCCPAAAPSKAKSPAGAPSAAHPAGACSPGMARLSGGSFTMTGRHETVTVHPFCMDLTEVTVDAYTACVQAGNARPKPRRGTGATTVCPGRAITR